MRLSTFFSGALAALAALGLADELDDGPIHTADIYIQAVHRSSPAPVRLAQVGYTVGTDHAEIRSFEAPELPKGTSTVRVGRWDAKEKHWLGSTTVASAENLARGYAPTVVLTVDSAGRVLGAALRGAAVDAGKTRDFGPRALVSVQGRGKSPTPNPPIVLSADGKVVVPQEKSFLQKYALVIRPLFGHLRPRPRPPGACS